MIIVEFMGGMGNQMFQYAMGKSLSNHLNTGLKFDLTALLDRTPKENFAYRNYDLDVFNLSTEKATQKEIDRFFKQSKYKFMRLLKNLVINKIDPHPVFREPHFHFTPKVYDLPKNSYLAGYWQSPRYFENIKEDLRRDFTFKEKLLPVSQNLARTIRQENSICIHVRRTDFLAFSFHGVCDMKYYTTAMKIIAEKISNPYFFIFSDDLQWCKENFGNEKYDITFVDEEHNGFKNSNYLQLMSMCRHFIIPNSSFAWWAAWLNGEKDKIVIAPKTWVTDPAWDSKDLISPKWIRVKN